MKFRNLKSPQRISPKTSGPLMSRLAAYSTTAGAALLAAPATEAAIQNLTTFSYDGGATYGSTPPDDSASHGTNLPFLAATAGHKAGFVGYLELNHYYSANSGAGIARLGGHIANHTFSGMVSKLAMGAAIPNRVFSGPNGAFTLASRSFRSFGGPASQASRGEFLPNGAGGTATGYAGFKANFNGQTYYGWLHVKVSDDGNNLPFEVSLISRNGDPGIFGAFGLASDNITAGETALAAPEPSVAAIGGLGLLALGAAGVRELRRRKASVRK